MVKEPTKLRRNYVKSWTFRQDVASILPTDLLYIVLGTGGDQYVPGPVLVRINRLLRYDHVLDP